MRSGNLAEQLGILLLQNVALVSPVPRTEDVGIDVVATLIRAFDGYNYIAEDSFFVQIKSSSVKEITFKDEQVKWLTELQLPLFIASVDKKTSTVALYTTHYLSNALVANFNRKEIVFELADCQNVPYDCSNGDESIKIAIGPPVISWSLNTLESNPDFLNEFYHLLKLHVLIAKKSIETRRVGLVELISWETSKEPVRLQIKMKSTNGNKESEEVTAPYLQAYLTKLALGEDIAMTRSIYRLMEKVLQREGHFVIVNGEKKLIPFDASDKISKE